MINPARITRRATLELSAAALLAAACGGKSEGDAKKKGQASGAKSAGAAKTAEGTAAPAGGGTAAPAGGGTAAPAGGGTDLKATVWYAGAKYTLGELRYDSAEKRLTVQCEIENLLSTSQTASPPTHLEAEGAVLANGSLVDYKDIIAKAKVKTALQFDVDKLDVAKTTLVFGDGEKEQARVPLTGAGPNVTREPVKQEFKGDIAIGPMTFSVEKVEVRWDDVPHDTAEVKKDKAHLVLVGKLKNNGTADYYFATEKFVITQPDGSKVTGEHTGPESSVAPTKTLEGFYVIFILDAKGGKFAGDYTLDVSQDWGADGAAVSASQKLTLK